MIFLHNTDLELESLYDLCDASGFIPSTIKRGKIRTHTLYAEFDSLHYTALQVSLTMTLMVCPLNHWASAVHSWLGSQILN